MKLALIGYGQMGRAIEAVAADEGAAIVSRIDPGHGDHASLCEEAIAEADVCIDFTHPGAVLGNIREVLALGKPLVVGTTGWEAKHDEVAKWVSSSGTGLVYAENFSLGVLAFREVLEEAAERFGRLNGYDVAGFEIHHHRKADSPSGTGIAMAEAITERFASKSRPVYDKLDRRIESDELHFASLRCGEVPGTHTVIFSSAGDTITLTHQAHNREAWARGAVAAAKWILGRQGMHHVSALFKQEVPCTVS